MADESPPPVFTYGRLVLWLVLALMLSSANNSFAANAGILKKLSSDLIHLDHLLRTYGPEANEARANLRAYTTRKNDELFPVSNIQYPPWYSSCFQPKSSV